MIGLARLAGAALLPVMVWLGGLVVFAMLGVGGLFAGPNPVYVIARVTAYVTVFTVAAVTLAIVAMFGLACGAMLTWLGENTSPRRIANAMGRSFWCLAAYVWLGVALLVAEPPVALTVFEMAEPDTLEERLMGTSAFEWMARLRYGALVGFLGVAAWSLTRSARPLNAILSIAFGAAALSAGIGALGLLAGPSSVP